MSDAVDHGITVTEIAAMDQPIDVSPETTAAFVGRALRGPLNIPVFVQNFGEFRRRFGGVWSRSSLGPSVQQFFQHGGKNLYVVRVANNARGAMICIPASGSAMVLRALEPGSTECIRAAVDYDRIDDDEHFNLTLQRIDPGTGLILDQEMFRQVSYVDNADEGADFVITQLFYDNADFFDFRRRCAEIGITAPIVPGVLPVTNFAQIQRITSLCGANLSREFVSDLEACGDDRERFSRADEQFHLMLAECTRNPLMVWLYRQINDVRSHALWDGMKDKILTATRIAEYNRQHRELYEALCNRDVDAATRIIAAHLDKARRDLLGADVA